jgi:methionyl-tRNA formyltransferase
MIQQLLLRIVLCGTVQCTEQIARQLVKHRANLAGIAGLAPEHSTNVSGYINMSVIADELAIPYYAFKNINEQKCVEFIRELSPDIVFITGLSQLVKDEILKIPRLGIIGFHPTPLPKGRGRAPIAWLTHDKTNGAATFFLLGSGVDDGAIFVQEKFIVEPNDHASEVEQKMLQAMNRGLGCWLPRLIQGEWNPVSQDETLATYNEIRKPEDGVIDWIRPAEEIFDLIRSASTPHPGAYTFVNHAKLRIWRARLETSLPVRGIAGRILRIDNNGKLLIQTGTGLIWLDDFDWEVTDDQMPKLRVGMRLGYIDQNEIYYLHQKLSTLEHQVNELCKKIC